MLPIPVRVRRLELLDTPEAVQADIPANLGDLRLLNRWFGGTDCALTHVLPLLRPRLSLLDVATGSADIPLSILRQAERCSMPIHLTGVDISDEVLDEARRNVAGAPVRLQQADARALPFPDRAFDVVLCCLALHHFSRADARRVLVELWRVAKEAVIVTDLVRSYPSYVGTWLVTHTVAAHRLTRHDGPLSVLRSYNREELLVLAEESGWEGTCHYRHSFCRQAIVARRAR